MNDLIFGCDHAGLNLKKILMEHLKDRFQMKDMGTYAPQSCDYPAIAALLVEEVLQRNCLGILICGSGIGMSMAANKKRGIRAALCVNEYMARMSRRHNNANVLCLGERVVGVDLAKAIADVFLETEFEGGRHQRRIDLFDPQSTF